MKIKIIGGETLGTRSLATFVECNDLRILIDPGVALGPRFNLLPHPLEYNALYKTRKEIEKYAEISDAIFISHYHYDHFTPFWSRIDNIWTFASNESANKIYTGKTIFLKNPQEYINRSQNNRANQFLMNLRKVAKNIYVSDFKEFKIGSTLLRFSQPMPHGEEGTPLGYVIMLQIEEKGEKFLFASDIEGPISEKVFEKIKTMKPNILLLSGPPLYLLGSKLSQDNFDKAMENLSKLTSYVDILILDHHLLRSNEALNYIKFLKEEGDSRGSMVMTINEYNNENLRMLEARRKELYYEKPPDQDFIEWTKKKIGLPPINYD